MNKGNRLKFWFICSALLLVVFCYMVACANNVIVVQSSTELRQILQQTNSTDQKLIIQLASGIYKLQQPLILRQPHIIIRGEEREKVILTGGGMHNGISQIFVVEASDITIENMTLGWVQNHGVQVRGEKGVNNTIIRNVQFVDCYEQMLKVSANLKNPNEGSQGGLVEDCVFKFSAGVGPQWYIGGIDAHNAKNWIVRRNTFENIRSPVKQMAEYAIHFWSGSKNTLVEANNIVNCDRGIGFGLGKSWHLGGVIRDNQIHTVRDVGIGLESAAGVQVLNNTVITENYPNSIEYRFSSSRNILIKGNRVSGKIVSRDGGQAVVE